ncbi:MAG: PAS domain S-box protein, partial [Anaerolineales bacterium]
LYLYSLDRERFVGYWAIGWGLQMLRYAEGLISHPTGVLALVSHIFVLDSGLFLIWGTYLMVQKKFPKVWFYTVITSTLLLAGFELFQYDHRWINMLSSTVLAGTFFCTGITLILQKMPRTWTGKFSGTSFFLWGLQILSVSILENLGAQSIWASVAGVMLGAAAGLSFLMLYFQGVRFRLQRSNQELSQIIEAHRETEAALLDSEEKYRAVVENADEAIFIAQDGQLKFFNSRTMELSGYTAEEIQHKPFMEFIHPEDRPMIAARHQARLEGDTSNPRYEFRMIDRQGDIHWWEINPVRIEWKDKPATLNFVRDISHERTIQLALEQERAAAQRYLDLAGVIMLALDHEGRVTMVNPRGCEVLGMGEGDILGKHWVENFTPQEARGEVGEILEGMLSGNIGLEEYVVNEILTASGSRRMIAWHNTLLKDANDRIIGTLSSGEDVTERNRAEEALQESENQLRTLFEQAPMGIITIDGSGKVIDANARSLQMLGSPDKQSTVGLNVLETPTLVKSGLSKKFRAVLDNQQPQEFETWYTSAWGKNSYFWARILPRLNVRGKNSGAVLIFDDLTERHMGERLREVMVSISTALRAARSKVEMYPIILGQVMKVMEMDGACLGLLEKVSGDIEVVLGSGIWRGDTGTRIPAGKGVTHEVIRTGKPYLNNGEEDSRIYAKGEPKGIQATAALPLIAQDEIVGVLWAGRQKAINEYDLRALSVLAETAASAMHRASLHEETRLRSRRLAALRTIDSAISTSFDIFPIFEVLLEAVETQLNVDAAAIWTYSSHTQTIDFIHGRGFEENRLRKSSLRLGQGLAGRVAVERRLIRIERLAQVEDPSLLPVFTSEDFCYYQGVPLIAKGEIKGVLEVYHRSTPDTNWEWQEFLNTLAGQAAIAIDNSELFNNLQATNFELSLAYDETLEGWARALEMRDLETLGHSDRVTSLTLRLAEELGVDDSELVHIRRGALLHDIGKMGTPDQILNKPGPLDADEWQVMKQHPEHAYRMLSPIRYLRQALDIPYCHHEKWNGKGYPRGLKGREIPLSARLFAVVDVWDALLSDRPYRPAWTEERAFDLILSESGKHFDPMVVDAFMRLKEKGLIQSSEDSRVIIAGSGGQG